MTQPMPPFAFFMGGNFPSFPMGLTTVVHGAQAVQDALWPAYPPQSGTSEPDYAYDNPNTVPDNHIFMMQGDKPQGPTDYPAKMCAATGMWGAPSAMVCVDGQWYLRDYAPDSRIAKKYPPVGSN